MGSAPGHRPEAGAGEEKIRLKHRPRLRPDITMQIPRQSNYLNLLIGAAEPPPRILK